MAKPFLKWAGGKTQLLEQIKNNLSENILSKNFTYIEPFVGGGAVLFWMLERFPNMEKVVINDINKDLINVYKVISNNPNELIDILQIFENEYHSLENSEEQKKEYYYQKRDLFNSRNSDKIEQSALFIFLNRTCFNGLYRVNRKNEFNVPMGSYKKPMICDKKNILEVNKALQKVEILCGDFEKTEEYANKNTFFYLDPPYKPLSETSNFNSYSKENFDDEEQIRLKKFCDFLESKGSKWMLSNSDVRAYNPKNDFFDNLYIDFCIERVCAKRNINSNAEKRGKLTELLVFNYKK